MMIDVSFRPVLDCGFVPAVLWNRAYRARCAADPESEPLAFALSRPDGTTYTLSTAVLPHVAQNAALNRTYVERLVKFLLWSKGGSRITIAGNPAIGKMVAEAYSPKGKQPIGVTS